MLFPENGIDIEYYLKKYNLYIDNKASELIILSSNKVKEYIKIKFKYKYCI